MLHLHSSGRWAIVSLTLVEAWTAPDNIGGTAPIFKGSSDTCLCDRGDRTNTNYDVLFDEYLEILVVGLREKSASIVNVLAEWDRVVLPNSHTGYVKKSGGSRASRNKRAMEALRAEKLAVWEVENDGDEGGEVDESNAPGSEG
ncbi:hypothetical protein C8J57DRAFT_1215084 [Mycena rebaudengoi]|nr:hypothetical protein C8J57DRAFT_1215084 [Mycena rebaudengoi]